MLATLQAIFDPKIGLHRNSSDFKTMEKPQPGSGDRGWGFHLRDGCGTTKYSRYEPSRLQFDSATN
jgi:hypothetical protein